MKAEEVLARLTALGDPKNVAGMERFGIKTPKSFGIRTPLLKQFAREVKKQAEDRHALAQELWETGNFEARAVARILRHHISSRLSHRQKVFGFPPGHPGNGCLPFRHLVAARFQTIKRNVRLALWLGKSDGLQTSAPSSCRLPADGAGRAVLA